MFRSTRLLDSRFRFCVYAFISVNFTATPWVSYAHGLDDGEAPKFETPRPTQPYPDSTGAFDPHAVEGVVDQFRLWSTGSTLQGCFFGGSPQIREAFLSSAQEIIEYGNLHINFGSSPNYRVCDGNPYHLRVSFDHTLGNWSYVGTDSTRIAYDKSSMNIGYANSGPFDSVDKVRLRGVVLHEMGHAIGLQHEHQSPEAHCEQEFDWPKIYSSFKTQYGWDQQKVDDNLRGLLASPRLRATPYDKGSIMNYYFPAWMFKNGVESPCSNNENLVLSEVDKKTIAETYPATGQEQVKYMNHLGDIAKPVLARLLTTDNQRQWAQDLINSNAQMASPSFKINITTNQTTCTDGAQVNVRTGNGSAVGTCLNTGGNITIGTSGN